MGWVERVPDGRQHQAAGLWAPDQSLPCGPSLFAALPLPLGAAPAAHLPPRAALPAPAEPLHVCWAGLNTVSLLIKLRETVRRVGAHLQTTVTLRNSSKDGCTEKVFSRSRE